MRQDMVLTFILAMDCGAAWPALRRARDYLRLTPTHRAVTVCCEGSNAAHFPEANNIGLIIGNSVFADGGAAILTEEISPKPGLQLLDFVHLHDFNNAATVATA